MKTKQLFGMLVGAVLLATGHIATSCSTSDGDMGMSYDVEAASGISDKDGNGGEDGNSMAGIVTAGEWNDLDHWDFWSRLMLAGDFSEMSDYWKFHTGNRVAIKVTDNSGNALAGVNVKLLRQTETGSAALWETVTDNHGLADCWLGLSQREEANAATLLVSIDGQTMEGHPAVCPWDSLSQVTVNHYAVTPHASPKPKADIAFFVDATGSMGDEINFLKSDLTDIIGKAAAVQPTVTMRTAALFYRDEGDDYLTRTSDFTEHLKTTAEFVKKQKADGGGDYPEAVHTALEHALQNLSWDENARTRLAFLILDAPAHHRDDVILSLQRSITLFAKKGIKLVPVAASGVDKQTEFMLRFFAIATGGTYVFLTDDSGVGYSHIEPTVGDYQVELLNQLLIRLIGYYTE